MIDAKIHNRATGAVRLLLALWLMLSAMRTLSDPHQAVTNQGLPMSTLLPLAGLYFAVGIFLLTGFMSRVMGLALVALGVWQLASFGFAVLPLVLLAAGVYLALRGGGAWAMDIYVQKMQDRARQPRLGEGRADQ
jgi:uncharacterized membrane protein YphA (DoxX/SURF4 family)